jgi:predicted ribosome quality control (RQC) complex YloA/Tae2 family protein
MSGLSSFKGRRNSLWKMKGKFREFHTNSGKLVLAGKDAEQNEKVVKQAGKQEIVLHTEAAGSPFVNIKGKATKRDLREAAVFCAQYSRDWKKNKKNVEVHYFKGKDVYKDKKMKQGTFGVKKFKKIIVNKTEILKKIKARQR